MTNMWEAELICIVAAPFITFWCADAYFKISGALAVLVLGLWMSSHRAVMSPEVEEIIHRYLDDQIVSRIGKQSNIT